MKLRSLSVPAIAALVLTASPAVYASPVSLTLPVHAIVAKIKNVSVSFKNDSGAPLELQAGDNVIKLNAGQTMKVQLPAGTKVLANTATAKLASGAVVAEVASYLDGATISIK